MGKDSRAGMEKEENDERDTESGSKSKSESIGRIEFGEG